MLPQKRQMTSSISWEHFFQDYPKWFQKVLNHKNLTSHLSLATGTTSLQRHDGSCHQCQQNKAEPLGCPVERYLGKLGKQVYVGIWNPVRMGITSNFRNLVCQWWKITISTYSGYPIVFGETNMSQLRLALMTSWVRNGATSSCLTTYI